jgi:hypothetical protein
VGCWGDGWFRVWLRLISFLPGHTRSHACFTDEVMKAAIRTGLQTFRFCPLHLCITHAPGLNIRLANYTHTRPIKVVWAVANIFSTRIKRHAEIKPTALRGKFRECVGKPAQVDPLSPGGPEAPKLPSVHDGHPRVAYTRRPANRSPRPIWMSGIWV